MSSKRFKGVMCVYCSQEPSVTGDHLFAREFFLPIARGNLPQVPVCDRCNNEKSKLEHYLTAVLPFGGFHKDAHENLSLLTPGRLANNQRLKRELSDGAKSLLFIDGQTVLPTISIPIDQTQLCNLCALIGRGLAWHHWGVYLEVGQISKAMIPSRSRLELFASHFEMNGVQVQNSLGDDTVRYCGIQAVDNKKLTLWRIQFYGGLLLADGTGFPHEVAREIVAVTGSEKIVNLVISNQSI